MIISFYLYHSARPTPERNVYMKSPCTTDHDLLRLTIGDESGGKTLTGEQIDRLEELCDTLMINPETNQEYKNFYEALIGLPFYDGLQLSAIFSLIKKHFTGGDILRMSNNVLRLNEWQKQNQGAYGASNTVLSLKMDEDWSKEHYGESTDRLTEFLLEDLEFLDDGDNDDDDDVNRDVATASIELEKAKMDFVAMVNSETETVRLRSKISKKHYTKDRIDNRSEIKAKLRADELLGPILSKLQTIVDSAFHC